METIQDAGSIPAASILKELKMPDIKFKNDVTVFFRGMYPMPAGWQAHPTTKLVLSKLQVLKKDMSKTKRLSLAWSLTNY